MRIKTLFMLMITAVITAGATDLLYQITDGTFKTTNDQIPSSMNDGEHYTLMTDQQTIVRFNYKTGAIVDTLLSVRQVQNAPIKSFEGYIMSPREKKILVYNNKQMRYRRSFTADYYIYDIKYKEFDPLSSQAPQAAPVFSPDDRYIAFAHEHNLYMKKVDFKTDIQITKDGEFGKISNGIPDWLYEEEFEATHHYAWSPDSKLLAFVKFDESEVRAFSFQTFLDKHKKDYLLYPEQTAFKYPKAGEKNARAIVCVYDDYNKTTRVVKLIDHDTDYYIPRIKWTNNSDQLAVFQLNRNQNRLDMYAVNPKTMLAKLLTREESKTYIDYKNIDYLKFCKNSTDYYGVSSRDGYRHIYRHRKDGSIAKQVTKGNWDITDFYGVDEKKNVVYYQSAESSPMQRQVYAIDAKGKKTNLTDAKGKNRAFFSKNFSYFVHQYSDVNTPDTYVLRTADGKNIREISNHKNLSDTLHSYKLNQKEFFSFNTTDGVSLNGWMLKPINFDESMQYPVLMIQYSGPDSQLVLDKWDIGWEYYLSTKGYITVCVDGRGTGARGKAFADSGYKQQGIPEAADQIATAKHLGSLHYIDKNRIGIWGWSYGGTVAILTMSSGEPVFKAGIAVAPVTDWRFYNTAYIERFMQTPEENFIGYENSSSLLKAEQLNGKLLLVHGTADDNVHYNNTLIYADRLVEAGKQFDMQIYTDKNHSILGKQTRRHLYTKMVDFLDKNLKEF